VSEAFFERKPWYEREGVMEATLWGHQLQRSRGYLNSDPVRTPLRPVDEHETILESHYQQWDILEHIRLLDQDRYRYRAIYTWDSGVLAIVGNAIRELFRARQPGEGVYEQDRC
jgi:hypothetical protein